jgi:hypothetical protein
MKFQVLFIFSILLMGFQARSQNFEGKVIFQNTYKSKLPSMNDAQLTAMMGARQEYLIKDGNYKITANGTFFQWQVYINAENKLYNKMSSSAKLLWNDGAVNTDEIIKSELHKGVVNILDRLCDELVLTCKSGIQKYYFSSDMRIDAKLFEKHKFGNWYEVVSRTHALPIKIIVENQQFVIESVAVEIIAMKVSDSEFVLPAGSQSEKSPY